jgi:signal transduction histidine kinase
MLLQQREQLCLLLESLVESLSDGLAVLDFSGQVVHVSASLSDRRTDADDPFPDSEDGGLPRAVVRRLRREARAMEPGQTRPFDLEWERPEQGTRVYRVIGAAELDSCDSGLGGHDQRNEAEQVLTVFAFHDRTREAALEHELTRAQELAALGQMAGTVAHELRNPLGAIQGFTTLLRRDLAGQEAPLRQVERILRGVESANRIVEDLLEYCRPLHPQSEIVWIRGLLEESLSHLKASARWSDGIECDLRLDPELPASRGDRRLLLQVLANLYDNAVAAMEGEGTLSIRVRTAGPVHRPDRLRIVIRDTGCGMSADEVARVFAPFYTNRPGGTGLGLALVRKIVDAHHGHVHVVSAPGRGTSVVLDLPAAGMELMPELHVEELREAVA